MKRFSTLRARFALWVAGLLLVALLAFGALVYASLSSSLKAGVDDSLQISAAQANAAVNIEDGEIAIADGIPETSAISGLRERGFTIRVLSSAGQLLQAVGPYRNLPVDPAEISRAAQQPTYATVTAPDTGVSIRMYTTPIMEHEQIIGVIQVARTLEDVQDTLQRLFAALLISIPVLVCGAALGGYALAARALAPIDAITRTARRISAEDLHARLNLPPTDDEVGRLAATFDLHARSAGCIVPARTPVHRRRIARAAHAARGDADDPGRYSRASPHARGLRAGARRSGREHQPPARAGR